MNKFKDKLVVVTGGSRGIGKAIVELFSSQGAKVAFSYNKNRNEAEKLVESIGEERCFAFPCDVSNGNSVKDFFDEIKAKFEDINVLVNNAGITADNFFALMNTEQFETVIKTNLLGSFYASKAAIKQMISKRQGVIINIASVSGLTAAEGQTNYSASKGGLVAMTRSLAKEVGKYNVRVVGVAPGYIETDMTAKIPGQMRKLMLEAVSLKRMGQSAEVANLVSFLASDEASYISGTTIRVDGGME
ncbi:MAG: 3-oxoacyl-ACP reductase FabG [Fibrobacter sp.]|nr:3-oxoacyl-ACP reductase FabG [Fibrobacter sp.]